MNYTSKDLSKFCRSVTDYYNLYLSSGYFDYYDERLKHSFVQSTMSQLMGFDNLSFLQHALKSGLTIDFFDVARNTDLEAVTAVLEILNAEDVLPEVLCVALKQAADIHSPLTTKVTISDEFYDVFPSMIDSEDHWEPEEPLEVYLSLVDHKIYPYCDLSYTLYHSIPLTVPARTYVHVLEEKLNSNYAQAVLANLHKHMPLLGAFATGSPHWKSQGIDQYNGQINAFSYNHMLLESFLKTSREQGKVVSIYDTLTWEAAAYLISNSTNPLDKLKADLPVGLLLSDSSEDFDLVMSTLIREGIFKVTTKVSIECNLPLCLYPYFDKYAVDLENHHRAGDVERFEPYGLVFKSGREFLKIKFVEPEYQLWIHYHQSYSHKTDYLKGDVYKTKNSALKGALELISKPKYEDLEPDFDTFSTKEFIVKIVDMSQNLHRTLELFYDEAKCGYSEIKCQQSLPYHETVRLASTRNGEYEDCDCRKCRLRNRICRDKRHAFVAGSGLSITSLRTPVLVIN
ncbi:hypothetical protein [Vibrio agarivorans]|uniref:Uncharacterized protein n=1 Tax=Vibrio agarivorans TaxID=153622 RepID=A0ABT7Y0W2_9VIBR|nr:hypothetical protein [Vibrio agarivorans]MDN2481676.1 hypothetical protein [Vibrio agarivorans]